jgi:CDP-2,3-bis-(O-geranylgeranyl)-sn-glycerol synthase
VAYEGVALLLLLLLVANGTPVVLKRVLGDRGAWPIDGGRRFRDGRPLLGRSKTWRGLAGALVATALVAWGLGSGAWLGAVVALAAHLGDMASSFTKRRLAIASSGRALGIDQIPESLLPALATAWPLGLGVAEVLLVILLFFVGELALSRLLFRLGIRDEPH